MQELLACTLAYANSWNLEIYMATVAVLAAVPVYFKLKGYGESDDLCACKRSNELM